MDCLTAARLLPRRCLAVVAVVVCACEPYFDRAAADAGTTDTDNSIAADYAGLGIGGACKTDGDCRLGLRCNSGKCAAMATTAENGKCLLNAECQGGLHCSWAGFCTPQPSGSVAGGAVCAKTADCAKGLFCKPGDPSKCAAGSASCGVCTAPSASEVAAEGEECTASSQCPPGMGCVLSGLSGSCRLLSGKLDLGAGCTTTAECLGGLACSPVSKQCVPGSVLLNPDLYPGVECSDAGDAAAPFAALVDVPRPGVQQDFYRFPFPSDVYKKNGTLDLSGHPSPGAGILGFDPIARVTESMGVDMTGWGLTSAAYFRFTRALDPKTLRVAGPSVPPAQATVRLVNLKTGADVVLGGGSASFHAGRNKYICRNWLYVHARWSEVLEPDTTYAVLVTDGVREQCGNGTCDKDAETWLSCPSDCREDGKDTLKPAQLAAPQAGRDMAALLAQAQPGDLTLQAAWSVYAPLRTWLKSNATVKPVAATVFTTMDTRKVTQQLVEASLAAGGLQLAGPPQLCKTNGPKSQCVNPNWAATALGKAGVRDPRDCPANADALPYYEIHAKIALPIFQQGQRPYTTYSKPTDTVRQGALNLVAGKPALVNKEPVCMALTIPKGKKPPAGWPLLVFAHGTSGSFRTGADQLGGSLTKVATAFGEVQMATLGIDQPMHANRRADPDKVAADTDPGPLFYNFSNPAAARGNFWQGAADNYSLLRWAQGYKGEQTPQGVESVTFDAANVVFMGHSQGATTGPMALPYLAGCKGAVLSGCGGSLVYGLLGKKLPYDAAVGLQIGLQDLGVDEDHPALNLLQTYFEVADPLIYAPLLHHQPVAKALPVLHTYGVGDNFTPATTSRIFAAAARNVLGIGAAGPTGLDLMDDLGVATTGLPVDSTKLPPPLKALGVTLQTKNDVANAIFKAPYDGHFVAFNDKTLANQVRQFIATLVKGVPTVVK
jgi:hypothetical protein